MLFLKKLFLNILTEHKRQHRSKTSGIGLVWDTTDSAKTPLKETHRQISRRQLNRNLIEYFIALNKHPRGCVNLEFLSSLLSQGADINCGDKYGQTVLHEVSIYCEIWTDCVT
jgi:hypothetical protein